MGRDKNRVELDSRFCKRLRIKAINEGFRSPKAYTTHLMNQKEKYKYKRNNKDEEFSFW